MSDSSCEHFNGYIREFGYKSITLIHSIFSASVSDEARRRKVILISISSLLT